MDNKNTSNQEALSKQYLNNIIPGKILELPIEFISTGNMMLDQEIGGGIPKSRITEVYGNESCGKTTLTLQIAKECTKQQKKVLYIDLEYSLDITYVKSLGINMDYFFVAHAKSGEVAFGMIEDALINQSFDLIVVDSVAAMVPEDEADNRIEDTNSALGSHARLMSRGVRKIQMSLSSSSTALIFINQVREKIGVMFGNPETTTGGKALRYYSSLRLEIKKIELIKNGQDKVGIKSKITIVKNKIAKPFGSAFINIYFGEGFDYTSDVLEYAVESGIIKKSGSWFSHNGTNVAQGINQLKAYANEHPEWFQEIKQTCLDNISMTGKGSGD